MYKILEKQVLSPAVTKMVIDAPHIAKKAQPGQFIILRIDENGERIPLTIADYDREKGTITIVFQGVGKTTHQLAQMNAGDELLNFVGPLGTASHLGHIRRVAVIGGGLGTAIAYPQAKALHEMGAHVDAIIGFRNQELVFFEEELKAVADRLFVMTDDGSNGSKGFVTDALKKCIEEGAQYDEVIAIGPLIMMKMICNLTKEYGIKTTVSMNPIMIDGTGMCGGCRLTVGGETKFACVDGPDFDGHLVDFDEAMHRNTAYREKERESDCNLMKMGGNN